ncbi:hypothetical protein [Spiroplasma alleghenense]|uniref:Uncharacterized protein n=1 Tax=Spiroplasma alleghenense TaxID=216931 RepID=A0A345Z4Z0_9MOLU|nr:hypothetical protein [Spiroplasma alleghenense]AXK51669.1 hypothetical protein SALLE_v1c09990 [Spiroplasma alleghenense]
MSQNSFKNIFTINKKGEKVIYWSIFSLIIFMVLLIFSNLFWMKSQTVLIRDLPGVESSFFNNFTNNGMLVENWATFELKNFFFTFSGQSPNEIMVTILITLTIVFLSYPLIDFWIFTTNEFKPTFKRSTSMLIFVLPFLIITIIQSIFYFNSSFLIKTFDKQFFFFFNQYDSHNLPQEILEQLNVARQGLLEWFNTGVQLIFSILLIIAGVISTILIIYSLFHFWIFSKPELTLEEQELLIEEMGDKV